MTEAQLKKILGKTTLKPEEIKQKVAAINETFRWYNINTPLRQAHFLAQVLKESGAFKYSEEIASGAAYEGRLDLGNTQKGDGKRYKGRGDIQLTGRANYREAGKDFNQPFEEKPEMVAEPRWATLIAGWFWNKRKLNFVADSDNIVRITRIVNGGSKGLDERKMWLEKVKSVL